MAVKEIVTQEELELYEILRNPALFAEFIMNFDREERDEVFEYTTYQNEFVLDFNNYVNFTTSRAVGKTLAISLNIIWALVWNLFPNDYMVYLVPGKAQLDPVWTNLVRMFRSNSLLKFFLTGSSGVNSSEFRITLLNNAVLLCRIAGQSGTGQNVIGLHTPYVFVDEGGYFPWNVFMEMQPIINTFTPGYKLLVSGVPSGMREKNVLYYCDQVSSQYSTHRVNAFSNPRFSEKDRQYAIEQYGGEDSEDYIHYVLGQHGKPVFALFDRTLMELSGDLVYKLQITGTELTADSTSYMNKISLFPNVPDRKTRVIFGIDLGYTEPTAIIILYLDRNDRIHFHGRIQLNKVSYPIQEKIIDMLDTKFNPVIIGIDKGGVGIPVVQRLLESYEYAHKNYEKKLEGVTFGAPIQIGVDANGDEIKVEAKQLSVNILQDYSNNHKIIYSNKDLEMITELERMTYTKNPSGAMVFRTLTPMGGKRGEDHFTSALLCAALAYYLNTDYIILNDRRKKLVTFSWI